MSDELRPIRVLRWAYANGKIELDEFERLVGCVLSGERVDHPDWARWDVALAFTEPIRLQSLATVDALLKSVYAGPIIESQ